MSAAGATGAILGAKARHRRLRLPSFSVPGKLRETDAGSLEGRPPGRERLLWIPPAVFMDEGPHKRDPASPQRPAGEPQAESGRQCPALVMVSPANPGLLRRAFDRIVRLPMLTQKRSRKGSRWLPGRGRVGLKRPENRDMNGSRARSPVPRGIRWPRAQPRPSWVVRGPRLHTRLLRRGAGEIKGICAINPPLSTHPRWSNLPSVSSPLPENAAHTDPSLFRRTAHSERDRIANRKIG